MQRLKPYPAYKDSGVPWLGEVPEHWGTPRLKRIAAGVPYAIVDGPFGTQLKASEYKETGIPLIRVKNLTYEGRFQPAGLTYISEEKWKELCRSAVAASDIVVAKTGATIGKSALLPERIDRALIASSCIKISLDKSRQDPLFGKYMAASHGFQTEVVLASGGSTRDTINIGPFGQIHVPSPPLFEQSAIVSYLDYMDRRIQRYIRAKQKLIKLLEEQKQAIIHQAVTGQIDVRTGKPYPKYKPSGVEWLGDVPEHWEVLQLRRIVQRGRRITYGIVQPGEPDPAGRFMIRGQDYSSGWAKPDTIFRVSDAIELPYMRSRLSSGDLVFTIVGAGVGNVASVPQWLDGANITQTTARISVDPAKADHEFIANALQGQIGKRNVEMYVKGAAQPGLNLEHVRVFVVPLPPLSEQKNIVFATGKMITSLLQAAVSASSEIALLREYRTRLISDVVTGKLDVREAAANLPEEFEEEQPEDQEQEDEENEDLVDEEPTEDEE